MTSSSRVLMIVLVLVAGTASGMQAFVSRPDPSVLDVVRHIKNLRPDALMMRLCDDGILRCGDSDSSLDPSSLDWSHLKEQSSYVDSLMSLADRYNTGSDSFRFLGDVFRKLSESSADSATLGVQAVRMYDKAYHRGSLDLDDNFVEAINYVAPLLCNRSDSRDSAFSLVCTALEVNPQYRPCLLKLVEWAETPQQIDSAISHVQNVGAITDSTSYRSFLELLERRLVNFHKELEHLHDQKWWLDSALAALTICKDNHPKPHLDPMEIDRWVLRFFRGAKAEDGSRHESAVVFLETALADGLAQPTGYALLAEALLQLAIAAVDKTSAFSLWQKSWDACSKGRDCCPKDYDDCCIHLCPALTSILAGYQPESTSSRDSLLLFFETIATKRCEGNVAELRESLIELCPHVLNIEKTADSLWLIGDMGAKAAYERALLYDENLPHSRIRLALIEISENLDMSRGGAAAEQWLLLGLRQMSDREYEEAIVSLRAARAGPTDHPDAAYCLALAYRLRADQLSEHGDTCEAALHLKLSSQAYGEALEVLPSSWLNLDPNRVALELESLSVRLEPMLSHCIDYLERQMTNLLVEEKFDEAIAECSTTVANFPDNITLNIYRLLGDAYFGASKFSNAEECFDAILAKDSVNPWGYLGMGMVLDTLSRLDSTRPKDAVSYLRKAVALASSQGNAMAKNLSYFHLGRVLIGSESDKYVSDGCRYICDEVRFEDERHEAKRKRLCDYCKEHFPTP